MDFLKELHPPLEIEDLWWTLYVVGLKNQLGIKVGIILEGPESLIFEQSLKFDLKTSNNQTKYKALIANLYLARELGAKRVLCRSDSILVEDWLARAYEINDTLL